MAKKKTEAQRRAEAREKNKKIANRVSKSGVLKYTKRGK